MSRLPTDSGAGETERIARPNPAAASAVAEGIPCPLEPTCHIFDGRGCAVCLQQGVENAQREGAPEKLERVRHFRQQFWIDTCRGISEMQKASPQVLELHRQHGCCFSAPSTQQVQQILDALDSACPGWGGDHAELFYQALKLNFPELQLRRA